MRRPSLDLDEPSRNLQESNAPPSDDSTDTDVDLSMPPPDDEVLDQDSRIFTPPPRIAARFYRPSTARRKDSAASSRRNSISSAHSRCSSIQHTGPRDPEQSKYIAQHLRRASFLEDRKARLADRAAHAEKVRHRAALAKATHRDITQSEERALAAQQARERNLAEIVANCAEEVKKAKQVAEFMKEKREQELIKMRAQIEERMAEAERRREEFRAKNVTKRTRGQSVMARKPIEVMPQVTESEARKLTDDEAASHIQGWWRGCLRKKTIKEFNNLGLTVDGIRDTQFDTVVELLAQEKVLLITARLLRICGLCEGDPGSVEEIAACRTFLSAFLILGHPNQVLANKNDGDEEVTDTLTSHRLPSTDLENPQLQGIVGKARDVLIAFENILGRLTRANRYTMPPALKKTLPQAYATFYNAFIAWKSRDSNALIEVMLMQFVELDAIFFTVKDTTDDAATALYKQSIRENQLMLIVRIKKLAGPEKGKKMIFEAVAEARKTRNTKKRTGDTKPRVAENAANEASETAESFVSPRSPESQTLTPPATPAKRESKGPILGGGLSALLPDNRIVVHELAINKEYQISAEEYKAVQSEQTEPFYSQMRANLDRNNNETNFQFFLMAAGNIKDKLQRLVQPGTSMHKLIGEILDLELAARQFAIGSFSYEKFFTAMASLLPKLVAPFRDDEVKELVQNKLADGNVIDRVEALHGFIDVMLCDYVNYLLSIVAPQLIESAAQYEAKRFSEDVKSGAVNLTFAEDAWRSARSKLMAEVQKRDPEGINHPKSRPTDKRIYAQMLVDAFTAIAVSNVANLPEMFELDRSRLFEISSMIKRIITVGAILLQCKNLLKRDVRSAWKMEASRIMTVLETKPATATAVDGIMAALESGRSMPAATKSQLRALVNKIMNAYVDMEKGQEPTEPVLRLLLTRLRGNIVARLAPGSASDKVKATNNSGEKLASLGLSEFVDKVRWISDLLDKIGSVDRAAHHPWWEAVATKVVQDEME
ncbi:T-complex protein 11-domain-containing protein [Thelonectria olida]|uniref:T-complex protein 11-domain-containing protein n=1 Tax=Thelonectria olida TaxID=1576542 RepID=A0A9P9AMX4_9HYPO|nr:T-complex protein 11-domain-containing protein [Thelonectria olida]